MSYTLHTMLYPMYMTSGTSCTQCRIYRISHCTRYTLGGDFVPDVAYIGYNLYPMSYILHTKIVPDVVYIGYKLYPMLYTSHTELYPMSYTSIAVINWQGAVVSDVVYIGYNLYPIYTTSDTTLYAIYTTSGTKLYPMSYISHTNHILRVAPQFLNRFANNFCPVVWDPGGLDSCKKIDIKNLVCPFKTVYHVSFSIFHSISHIQLILFKLVAMKSP